MFRQEEEGQVHHHPRGLQEDPGILVLEMLTSNSDATNTSR